MFGLFGWLWVMTARTLIGHGFFGGVPWLNREQMNCCCSFSISTNLILCSGVNSSSTRALQLDSAGLNTGGYKCSIRCRVASSARRRTRSKQAARSRPGSLMRLTGTRCSSPPDDSHGTEIVSAIFNKSFAETEFTRHQRLQTLKSNPPFPPRTLFSPNKWSRHFAEVSV